MEQEQVGLVKASWADLRPDARTLAQQFYENLFEIDPALRVLFGQELDAQQGKLVDMLEQIVGGLQLPDALHPQLLALGQRHVGYGVVDSDYHAVANALLAAIEASLSSKFTPALRQAWSSAFHFIAAAMKEGAATADPPTPGQLNPRERLLVQGSWRFLQAKRGRLARMFYGALFAREPSLRTLFADDMTGQRGRFLAAIDLAVQGLDDLTELGPTVAELGRRHVGYGVREHDYELVAQALIVALQRCLGETFTPELQSAWVEAYGLLAQMMLDGSQSGGGRRARRRESKRAAPIKSEHNADHGDQGSDMLRSRS